MLTDAHAKRAKAQEKSYKLSDSGGLYLYISTTGFKSWRLKYRFDGKEKVLTFGEYPEVSLAEAREKRDNAKRELKAGRDPSRQPEIVREKQPTFAEVAEEWHEQSKGKWTETHAADVIGSLRRDIFPILGDKPIKDISIPMVLDVLRDIENRGAIETAKRLRQRMSAVFVHAAASGLGNADPAASVTKALKPLPRKGKQPALTGLSDAQELLRHVEARPATPVTKLASRLLALTAARPGVLRRAEYPEFEGLGTDTPIWRVPAAKMKLTAAKKEDEEHEFIIPLSRQAVEVVKAISRLTGMGKYLFPSHRSVHMPMSANAIGYMYNREGYRGRHVPHGWRSTFSTVMNELAVQERRPDDRAIIDLMLAHVPKDKVEGAYNRAAYMPRRREIAQTWADLITAELRPADELLKGPRQ